MPSSRAASSSGSTTPASTEIYGFGKGPGGKPPNGTTLFEIGSVTKVYTSLLLADAVQRREVTLDTPVSELLPPGVRCRPRQGRDHAEAPRAPQLRAAAAAAVAHARPTAESVRATTTRTRCIAISITPQLDRAAGHAHSFVGLRRRPARLHARQEARRLSLKPRMLEPLALHDTFFAPTAAARRRARHQRRSRERAAVDFGALRALGMSSSARDQLRADRRRARRRRRWQAPLRARDAAHAGAAAREARARTKASAGRSTAQAATGTTAARRLSHASSASIRRRAAAS